MMWRKWLAGGVAVLSLLLLAVVAMPVPQERLHGAVGLELRSTGGSLLREHREARSGAFRTSLALEDYPEELRRIVVLAEDGRFGRHPGVDPLAVARAVWTSLRAGRVVSGGSTIHQQLARLVYRERMPERPLLRKPVEALYAIRLWFHHDHDEVLAAYLNQVPLRANRVGLATGARDLFQRDVRLLSRAEMLTLAALISHGHGSSERLAARVEMLRQRYNRQWPEHPIAEIRQQEFAGIVARVYGHPGRSGRASLAAHFVDWVATLHPGLSGVVTTTLDAQLNARMTDILRTELDVLAERKASNAAIVVFEVDAARAALVLRAMVGSRDFSDPRAGQVNAALAVRNPGSSLKPLLYARAMDSLGLHPDSLLEDHDLVLPAMTPGEAYRPRNYDLDYWGELSMREALATSRNIPAVELASRLGMEVVHELLMTAGLTHMEMDPARYGEGLVLGSGGARLFDLTRAYGAFLFGGVLPAAQVLENQAPSLPAGDRLFSARSALQISAILSDAHVRRRAFGQRNFLDFPFEVAAKTGTSQNYRDAWTVGYTSQYLVGVWVGDMQGEPMDEVSGARGAARIFHQAIRHLHRGSDSRHRFDFPSERIAALACEGNSCSGHALLRPARIRSPAPGEVFLIDPHVPESVQAVPLRISSGGRDGLHWSLNGESPRPVDGEVSLAIEPRRGEHRLELFRHGQRIDQIHFEVR